MAPPDRPRSESQSSSDDEGQQQPRSKRVNSSRIVDGFDNLTADDVRGNHRKVAFIAGQRRRRRFTPGRRKEVAELRSVGACKSCRARKVRCTLAHVLRDASPLPSASITINDKRASHHESSDSSNPSSVSSNSSIETQIGISQLESYLGSIEDDPPAGRLAEGSWSPYTNRDPMRESRSRLSPKIEEYLSIIPDQFQDVKNSSYSPTGSCMQDLDDNFKTTPSLFKQSKEELLRPYLPQRVEPLNVWAVRRPVPSGEQPPWDHHTGRSTTQPSRSAKNRVSKKKPKANSTGRTTPSAQGPQPEQGQRVHRTPPSQIIPQPQNIQYAPSQALTPGWTPSQRQIASSAMFHPQSMINQSAEGVPYGSFPAFPTNQMVGYELQQYGPQLAQQGQMQQYFTPAPTPSHYAGYAGSPSMARSGSAHSTQSLQSTGNGMQQHFTPMQNPSHQSYAGASSMNRSGSAHSTRSMQSVGNGLQQMNIAPQYAAMQAPFYQGYGNTTQVQHGIWQQPARQLNYGTNMDNNMIASASYGIPSMPLQLEYQPVPGNYASSSTTDRFTPAAHYYANTNRQQSYKTNTPSTSNSSNSMRNPLSPRIAIPAPPAAASATSQPPSLTIGASSEVTPNTPNTPFDTNSHHGGGELFSPQTHQAGPDPGFFSEPDMSTDQLFLNGFGPDVNEKFSPELALLDGYDTSSDTIKPPPSAVLADPAATLDTEVDMEGLSDWVPRAGIGAEIGDMSNWFLSSPGLNYANPAQGPMADSSVKPRPAGGVQIFDDDVDWNSLSPNMSDSVDGDRIEN